MVEIFNHWNVKPFSLSRANEYLEDLNDLRLVNLIKNWI